MHDVVNVSTHVVDISTGAVLEPGGRGEIPDPITDHDQALIDDGHLLEVDDSPAPEPDPDPDPPAPAPAANRPPRGQRS